MQNAQKIESAIMLLKGIEQTCLHMSVSDYMRASGDAEIFLMLGESIRSVRDSLNNALKDSTPQ